MLGTTIWYSHRFAHLACRQALFFMLKRKFLFFFCWLSWALTTPLSASEEPFDVWMGVHTSHWAHVKQERDLIDLQKYRLLFNKNFNLIHSAQGPVKIPRTVHFIWLGPHPFPPASVSNVRSWIAQNPDWEFKFWTDRPRDPPCRGMETIVIKEYPFSTLKRCYATSNNWGEKSDILRYEILYAQGGVYVDHDASCLQPFLPYHQAYDLFCGLETPHPPFIGRSITAGNGVIGSCPLHPVIKSVIDLIDQRWERIAERFAQDTTIQPEQIVIERTYIALTDALALALDRPGYTDIVLPAAYFFPKKGLKPILSEHFFANSWAGGKSSIQRFEREVKKEMQKIEKRFDRLTLLLLGLLALDLALLGLSICYSKRLACK